MTLKSSYNLFLIAEYFVFHEKVYRKVFVLIYMRTQIKFRFLIVGICDQTF